MNPATRAIKSYPVDDRALFWNGTTYRPFLSVAEANLTIAPLRRYKGLMVFIVSTYFIYKDGVLDADLVPLTAEGNSRSAVSFTKDDGAGFTFSYTLQPYTLIEKILLKITAPATVDLKVDGILIDSRDIGVSALGEVFTTDIVAYAAPRTVTMSNLEYNSIITIIKQKIS